MYVPFIAADVTLEPGHHLFSLSTMQISLGGVCGDGWRSVTQTHAYRTEFPCTRSDRRTWTSWSRRHTFRGHSRRHSRHWRGCLHNNSVQHNRIPKTPIQTLKFAVKLKRLCVIVPMNIAFTYITERPGEAAWTQPRCFINVRSAIGASVGLELVSDRKKC